MEYTLTMSSAFAKSAAGLPKDTRAKLAKVFMLLTENPRHPSLQLKKIEGARRDNIYECRLDQFWRIIVRMVESGGLDLVDVGRHDETIGRGVDYCRRPDEPRTHRPPRPPVTQVHERGVPEAPEPSADSLPTTPMSSAGPVLPPSRAPSRSGGWAVRRFLMGDDDALDFEPVTEESLRRVLGSLG